MPNMFCAKKDHYLNQCVSDIVVEDRGCLPISKIEFKTIKPTPSGHKMVRVHDDFYNYLKKEKYNPNLEEYQKILSLISHIYKNVPLEKKEFVLRVASYYCRQYDADVMLWEGLVLDTSFDYVSFYDHSHYSRCFRDRMLLS